MEPMVFYNSRWKYAGLLAVSGLFCVVGVFILLHASSSVDIWTGWGVLLFFVVCAPVFVWQLFDARPRLTIDDSGIEDRTLGLGLIPWDEIADAYRATVDGQEFISLVMRNPEQWAERRSTLQRALVRASRKLGFTEVNLNLGGVNANSSEILDLILKRVRS